VRDRQNSVDPLHAGKGRPAQEGWPPGSPERGAGSGRDPISRTDPQPTTTAPSRSGTPTPGLLQTTGRGLRTLESRTRGIPGGPQLVDARSSLSESLRGGAVTPRTWRFHVVTLVAARFESLSSGNQVSPSYLMTKEVKRI
jgi:hypothetical protein